MRPISFGSLTILLAFFLVSLSHAQSDRMRTDDGRTLELVDQLKELIQKAERDQRSNPWLVNQLRDVVRRYDWPWRVSLLYDDFRDGDFTWNPVWIANNGEFWVTRGRGLRSVFNPPEDRRPVVRRGESPARELLEGILWGGRERQEASNPPVAPTTAEIYTELPITNAFALKMQMVFNGYSEDGKRLEFGPYQSKQRHWGYRLAYEPGKRPSLSLLRISPGRSSVVEISDKAVDLHDGQPHHLEWRRGRDGEMVLLIDAKEIMRTIDRAYGDPFDGFSVINSGGDYEIRQIEIFGVR